MQGRVLGQINQEPTGRVLGVSEKPLISRGRVLGQEDTTTDARSQAQQNLADLLKYRDIAMMPLRSMESVGKSVEAKRKVEEAKKKLTRTGLDVARFIATPPSMKLQQAGEVMRKHPKETKEVALGFKDAFITGPLVMLGELAELIKPEALELERFDPAGNKLAEFLYTAQSEFFKDTPEEEGGRGPFESLFVKMEGPIEPFSEHLQNAKLAWKEWLLEKGHSEERASLYSNAALPLALLGGLTELSPIPGEEDLMRSGYKFIKRTFGKDGLKEIKEVANTVLKESNDYMAEAKRIGDALVKTEDEIAQRGVMTTEDAREIFVRHLDDEIGSDTTKMLREQIGEVSRIADEIPQAERELLEEALGTVEKPLTTKKPKSLSQRTTTQKIIRESMEGAKKTISASEDVLFRKQLRAQSRTAKDVAKKLRKTLRETVSEVKKTERLKAKSKIDEVKERIVKLKDKSLDIKTKRRMFESLVVRTLPKEARGPFIRSFKNIISEKTLNKEIGKLKKAVSKSESANMIDDLKDITEKIDKLPVRYKNRIAKTLEGYKFQGMKPETAQKLKDLQKFLEGRPEEFAKFGIKSRRQVKRIKELKQTDIRSVNQETLEKIYKIVTSDYEKGRVAIRLAEQKSEIMAELALKDLSKTSVNLNNTKVVDTPFEKMTQMQKAKNWYYAGVEGIKNGYYHALSSDIMFEILDGYKRAGANWKLLKQPIDDMVNNAFDMSKRIGDEYTNVKADIQAKYNMTFEEHNFNRIMVYATKVQEGGYDKLLKSNLDIDRKFIDNLKLDKAEMELYKYMREVFDDLYVPINETLKKVHGKELPVVDNYFSWKTDFEAPGTNYDRTVADFVQKTRTESGFTLARSEYGGGTIKLNAEDVFFGHIEDAAYFINLEEGLKNAGAIVKSHRYKELVGVRGQEVVENWIDTVSRKGVPANYNPHPHWLKKLMRNVGVATLGWNPSPVIKQPIAKVTSAAILGKDAFNPKWNTQYYTKGLGEYIQKASKQQKLRTMDDPAVRELEKAKKIGPYKRNAYKYMKKVDQTTADNTWYMAYRKFFKDGGKKFSMSDFKAGKVDDEARKYADFVVRRTQGSGEFKDLPAMFTDKNKDWTKMFLQFQTFVINESYLIPHDAINMALRKEKDPIKAAAILSVWVMTGIIEDYISSGYSMVVKGEDARNREKDKEFSERLVDSAIGKVPGISSVYSAIKYNSSGIPVYDVAAGGLKRGISQVTAKTQEARNKAYLEIAASMMSAFGLPGVSFIRSFVRGNILDVPDREKRTTPIRKPKKQKTPTRATRGATRPTRQTR